MHDRPKQLIRRWSDEVDDHNGGRGAWVTEWDGWFYDGPVTRGSRYPSSEHYDLPVSQTDAIDDACGCYAILGRLSDHGRVVLYIGFSASLRREVLDRLRKRRYQMANGHELRLSDAAAEDVASVGILYLSDPEIAKHYEDALIRAYAPPWNRKFHRQG